jgi:CubicO group peptidase (beta-lactamase class C family)
MNKSYTKLMQQALLCLVLMLLLQIPFLAAAQKKKPSNLSTSAAASAAYQAADMGHFMKSWWLLGPITITGDSAIETQKKFFNDDQLPPSEVHPGKGVPTVRISGKEFQWLSHTSKNDIIDLDTLFKKDYAIAYAWAEVMADSASNAFLVLGSDDAIKVWHNGKLVHSNWIARGVEPDQDMVPIALVKGSNQILIKVQDIAQGWGFTARFLDKAALSDRLIAASGKGDLDEINSLLQAGASVEKTNTSGLTALDAARLHGREEVAKLLLQKGAREHAFPSPEKLVDGVYSSLAGKVAPGVAVLIAKDGKIVYKKGLGYADIEKKEKVSPETKFRIGSVTKQFTAAAILKLQEVNRLSVTDKLSKYLPDFPRGEEVTIHHLLTHTSGIHSYTDKEEFYDKVTTPVSNENLLNFFKNDPYDFGPGEEYRYNNSGFFLLGYIIEKVSGKSYSEYVKDTFFDPLQMANTGVHTSALKLKNEAKGYKKSGSKYEKALNWDMSWAGGAGAIYSTVEDLYKWNEALFNGKVLNEKSLAAAFTSVKLNNGKTPTDGEYGYGIAMRTYRDLLTIQHAGGLHGFVSQLTRFPKENLTVAILTNLTPPEVNLNANTLAEFYLWDKMAKQSSYAAQSSEGLNLKDYVGRYDFRNGAVMTITSEGKELFAQLSSQQKFPIFTSAPDEFFWKVVDAKIKFVRNDKGEVTHGHFAQNGNEIDVPKLKEETIIALDPALYKAYCGKYDYGSNFFITISTENNKIFAQGTNQPKLEIFPVSEKEFILKDLNARISFIPGSDGKINKLNLDMAGQKKDAPKVE